MVLRKFYIRNDQDKFLRKLPGKMAEYVRLALDEYIEKIKGQNVSISFSEKGGENAKSNNNQ